MFIGHFAVGFAAKRVAPRASLAALFAAVQLADVLWPVFVATGLEQVRIRPGDTPFTPLEFVSYPYSHSLIALAGWGCLFGALYMTRASGGVRSLVLMASLVVSHWLLDFVSHRPDMPIVPGGTKFGLGLWLSVPGTIAVESGMFAVSVWIYIRVTRAHDAVGRWALAALVALLAIAYAGNILGGPPPSVEAIWIAGLAGAALILMLSWWADSHREPALVLAEGHCTGTMMKVNSASRRVVELVNRLTVTSTSVNPVAVSVLTVVTRATTSAADVVTTGTNAAPGATLGSRIL